MTWVRFPFDSRRLGGARSVFLVGFLASFICCRSVANTFAVKWVPISSDKRAFLVEVSGLSSTVLGRLRTSNLSTEGWQRILSVFVERRDPLDELGVPPMAGAYRVERGVIRFQPSYPLQPGVTYRAEFRSETLPLSPGIRGLTLSASFEVPRVQAIATTVVLQVYPTADVLPENLLKFYVQFSGPMSRGHIYEHIHLRDASGVEVALPFLEIDEELWDSVNSRLTLFIDPGRIKRGVQPLEEVGPALETGKRYTLVLDRDFKDGAGNPLKSAFEKSFAVSPPDRDPPDTATWRIEPPAKLSLAPLVLNFPEPLDHALALRMIQVTDESGVPVVGKAGLSDRERKWRFVPAKNWHSGRFVIHVQTAIEDLAGNNIGKAFDVDLFDGVQKRFVNSTVRLPFRVF